MWPGARRTRRAASSGAGHRRRRAARAGQGTGPEVPRPGPGAADDVLGGLSRGTTTPLTCSRRASGRPRPRGLPQVLTFGHTQGGNRKLWVERFKQLGPMARDHGVTIVVKQHGGETGTGAACAAIIREVDDEGIKVNYDAGNVMDYLDVDPHPRHPGVRRRSPRLLHQGPPQFPQGRGLRPRLRRDRPLPAAAPRRLHRPGHAALLREHLRPAVHAARRTPRHRRAGPPGPGVPRGGDPGIAILTHPRNLAHVPRQ